MAPVVRIRIEPGKRYGKLVVIEETRIQMRTRTRRGALCLCDCGNLSVVHASMLGVRTNSCGCGVVAETRKRSTSHGLGGRGSNRHPLYNTWSAMHYRCESSNSPSYQWYGALGVRVCDRWSDLASFVEDIDRILGPRPVGYSLDRVDPYGNYEPSNIRWADARTQTLNRRVAQ